MYKIKTPRVYIHERVKHYRICYERMQRLMKNISSKEQPVIVNDEQLDKISRDNGWPMIASKRTGELKRSGDPIIIFNTFRWAKSEEVKEPNQDEEN